MYASAQDLQTPHTWQFSIIYIKFNNSKGQLESAKTSWFGEEGDVGPMWWWEKPSFILREPSFILYALDLTAHGSTCDINTSQPIYSQPPVVVSVQIGHMMIPSSLGHATWKDAFLMTENVTIFKYIQTLNIWNKGSKADENFLEATR